MMVFTKILYGEIQIVSLDKSGNELLKEEYILLNKYIVNFMPR
jgi:hypothetical protein